MVNIGFIGDCEKIDVTLMVGMILQAYDSSSPVTIYSDRERHYRYFENEVSGMAVQCKGEAEPMAGTVLYDWHSSDLPMNQLDKMYAVTTYDKAALEFAGEIVRKYGVAGLIVLESECSINQKYIKYLFPGLKTFSCYDDPRRRMDWVYDGRISTRKIEPDFAETMGEIVQDMTSINSNELKKIWMFLKKRSA